MSPEQPPAHPFQSGTNKNTSPARRAVAAQNSPSAATHAAAAAFIKSLVATAGGPRVRCQRQGLHAVPALPGLALAPDPAALVAPAGQGRRCVLPRRPLPSAAACAACAPGSARSPRRAGGGGRCSCCSNKTDDQAYAISTARVSAGRARFSPRRPQMACVCAVWLCRAGRAQHQQHNHCMQHATTPTAHSRHAGQHPDGAGALGAQAVAEGSKQAQLPQVVEVHQVLWH